MTRVHEDTTACPCGLLQFKKKEGRKVHVTRQQEKGVTTHGRSVDRVQHDVRDLSLGCGMQVTGFGITCLIRVGEAFTGKIKLTFQQIKNLPVTGGPFQHPPSACVIGCVACHVIQHDKEGRVGVAPIMVLHEGMDAYGSPSLFGQGPGIAGFFEKDADAVFRRDHRCARKPCVQPHALV